MRVPEKALADPEVSYAGLLLLHRKRQGTQQLGKLL